MYLSIDLAVSSDAGNEPAAEKAPSLWWGTMQLRKTWIRCSCGCFLGLFARLKTVTDSGCLEPRNDNVSNQNSPMCEKNFQDFQPSCPARAWVLAPRWWNDGALFLCSWRKKWLIVIIFLPGIALIRPFNNHTQSAAAFTDGAGATITAAGSLRWKRNGTLWGQTDSSSSSCNSPVSPPVTYSEQELFPAWPPSRRPRRTRQDRSASSAFSVPEQQKRWSSQNTCRLKVMRPPILTALINSARP